MTQEQFAQLVLDSTDSLYRVSKGILKNDSDCEDAVWDAIGIGFAKLSTLREDKYAKTWLIRILIHECYRVLRERKFRADLPTEARNFSVSQSADTAVFHNSGPFTQTAINGPEAFVSGKYSDLYEALMILEEKYRIPIVLFYLEGYSVREIADILQSTENTVKSWLSRGRSRLKKILEEG